MRIATAEKIETFVFALRVSAEMEISRRDETSLKFPFDRAEPIDNASQRASY